MAGEYEPESTRERVALEAARQQEAQRPKYGSINGLSPVDLERAQLGMYGNTIGLATGGIASRPTIGELEAMMVTPQARGQNVVLGGVKAFTRAEVLLMLRTILASNGGIAEAITAFERIV